MKVEAQESTNWRKWLAKASTAEKRPRADLLADFEIDDGVECFMMQRHGDDGSDMFDSSEFHASVRSLDGSVQQTSTGTAASSESDTIRRLKRRKGSSSLL